MSKRVLFISAHMGFMVNAIIDGMESAGFEVVTSTFDIDELSNIEQRPRLWVAYTDEEISNFNDALVYIKDTVTEREIPFFAIGDVDGLFGFKKIVPLEIITKEFLRPFDVNELIEALDKASDAESRTGEKKKILIVDDNATTLRRMKNLLESRYQCYMANSGMNAITFLANNTVDLILLDYEMPVVNGVQVLKMIRSDPSMASIPVMFLTGKSSKDVVMEVASLKPEKYLLKSMSPVEVIKSIEIFFKEQRLE